MKFDISKEILNYKYGWPSFLMAQYIQKTDFSLEIVVKNYEHYFSLFPRIILLPSKKMRTSKPSSECGFFRDKSLIIV
jgi:hypothetical protein